jgi:hypothetical protein
MRLPTCGVQKKDNMRFQSYRFFVCAVFGLVFSAVCLYATDSQAGKRAYEQKDFASAMQELAPLAQQGNADAQLLLHLNCVLISVSLLHLAQGNGSLFAAVLVLHLGSCVNHGTTFRSFRGRCEVSSPACHEANRVQYRRHIAACFERQNAQAGNRTEVTR